MLAFWTTVSGIAGSAPLPGAATSKSTSYFRTEISEPEQLPQRQGCGFNSPEEVCSFFKAQQLWAVSSLGPVHTAGTVFNQLPGCLYAIPCYAPKDAQRCQTLTGCMTPTGFSTDGFQVSRLGFQPSLQFWALFCNKRQKRKFQLPTQGNVKSMPKCLTENSTVILYLLQGQAPLEQVLAVSFAIYLRHLQR